MLVSLMIPKSVQCLPNNLTNLRIGTLSIALRVSETWLQTCLASIRSALLGFSAQRPPGQHSEQTDLLMRPLARKQDVEITGLQNDLSEPTAGAFVKVELSVEARHDLGKSTI